MTQRIMTRPHFSLWSSSIVLSACVLAAFSASSTLAATEGVPKPRSVHSRGCEEILNRQRSVVQGSGSSTQIPAVAARPLATTAEAKWQATQQALRFFGRKMRDSDSAIQSMAALLLAGEHGWFSGGGGGGKTFLAEALFKAELRGIPLQEKKLFVQQFHKLITENVIVGGASIDSQLNGREEIDLSTSLAADNTVFGLLDEIEKAPPSVLVSLLSVLNERRVFLGTRVVDLVLRSVMALANKNIDAIRIAAGRDWPAIEALLDRIVHKRIIPNQFSSVGVLISLDADRRTLRENARALDPAGDATTYFGDFSELVQSVQIPDEILAAGIHVLEGAGRDLHARQEKGFLAANQYSKRNVPKGIMLWQANFIAQQLMDGVPYSELRTKMEPRDLVLISDYAVLGAPGRIQNRTIEVPKPIHVGFAQVSNAKIDVLNAVLIINHPENVGSTVRARIVPVKGKKDQYKIEGDISLSSKESIDLIIATYKKALSEIDEYQRVETDGVLESFLEQRSELMDSLEADLSNAQAQRNILIGQLDLVLGRLKNKENLIEALGPAVELPFYETSTLIQKIDGLAAVNNPNDEQLGELAWLRAELFIANLKNFFVENDHAIHAMLSALLGPSGTHVLLLGPPGSGKTLLVNTMIEAALRGWRSHQEQNEEPFRAYIRQFHPQVSEGAIAGFEIPSELIRTGRTEYDLTDSLANPLNIYALLDEISRAHPGVKQRLFPILNEGRISHGHFQRDVGLRNAFLTTNNTVAEEIQSFGTNEQETGKAYMDRIQHKVHVHNKFTTPRVLFEFLKGMKLRSNYDFFSNGRAYLDIPRLLLMTENMTVAQDDHGSAEERLGIMASRIVWNITRKRYATAKAMKVPAEVLRPVPAALPTGRTQLGKVSILDRLRPLMMMEQLTNMVAFNKRRTKVEHIDLFLLRYGLTYWIPEVKTVEQVHGIKQLRLESPLRAAIDTGLPLSQRERDFILWSLQDQEVAQSEINNEISSQFIFLRDLVGSLCDLFPSLVSNRDEVRTWLESITAGQRHGSH